MHMSNILVSSISHILYNTGSIYADVLSNDVESIVLKIYKYLSIFTVRNKRLKLFCKDADIKDANL